MKETQIDRLATSLSAAVLVLFLSGCSMTIGTSPDAYPFPSEEVFSVRPGVAANVTNFYAEPEVVELASRVFCDLQHFTADRPSRPYDTKVIFSHLHALAVIVSSV